jgi:hypothetical protein
VAERNTESKAETPRQPKKGDTVELHLASGAWRKATVTNVRGDRVDLAVAAEGDGEDLVLTSVPCDPSGKAGDCYRACGEQKPAETK